MNQEEQPALISPDNLPPFVNMKPSVSRSQMKFAEHIHPRREQQLLRPNENMTKGTKPKGFETVANSINQEQPPEEKELANIITDEKAIAIYKKLQSIAANSENKRIKRNWHHSETHLLYWVIKSYSKEQKIDYSDFSLADWEKISQFVPGRNANQCQYKWQSNHKPKNTKAPWTAQEDSALRKIIERKGAKSWADISRILNNQKVGPTRQGKQCRQRWYNHVNPAIKWDSWTEWEDITLLKKQQNLGNKWSEIAKCIPGRTQNSVKNRFNSLAKKERTKLQEQNKAKKKTSAQNATDLKQSMNCFFKQNMGEANNDIWINPLVQRLKNTYFRKHQSPYDMQHPPESDLEYLHKNKDMPKQPPKRVVIYKEDIISSSSSSPEEFDDSDDSQFKLTVRQKQKHPPPPRKINLREERKKPRQIRVKSNKSSKMTLRTRNNKEINEPEIVIEQAKDSFKQTSSLSVEEEDSYDDILRLSRLSSQKLESELDDESQFVLDNSLQEEFESKGRKIISEIKTPDASARSLLPPKHALLQEPEGLEKRQMSRILRSMSLGNHPLFRYEEHFQNESSGLLQTLPKGPKQAQQTQQDTLVGQFLRVSYGRRPLDQVLRKIVLSKCFTFSSQSNPQYKLHLSNDAIYGDDGVHMYKLSNLDLYQVDEREKKQSGNALRDRINVLPSKSYEQDKYDGYNEQEFRELKSDNTLEYDKHLMPRKSSDYQKRSSQEDQNDDEDVLSYDSNQVNKIPRKKFLTSEHIGVQILTPSITQLLDEAYASKQLQGNVTPSFQIPPNMLFASLGSRNLVGLPPYQDAPFPMPTVSMISHQSRAELSSSNLPIIKVSEPEEQEELVNNPKPVGTPGKEENIYENFHDSTRSFQFVKREANSVFAVPNECQSEMIAKKIKDPHSEQPLNIPNMKGPSSFANNSIKFKELPQNQKAFSEQSSQYEPQFVSNNEPRRHYDYDCSSVVSRDQLQ